MEPKKRYLIVDDDKANNLLCKVVLKKVLGEIDIVSFDKPQEALDYIANEYSKSHEESRTYFFLDINMPEITGWEFLERFKHYDKKILNQFTTYILSSSVNSQDKELAQHNPLVNDYIEKPLTRETVKNLFNVAAAVH